MKNCTSTNDSEVSITSSKPTKETKVDYTSEEFWKDAPEGRNFLLVNKEDSLHEFFIEKPERDIRNGLYWMNLKDLVLRSTVAWELIERPQPKPVYTQEMYDKGELPPVGSEFMHKGQVATVLSTSSEHDGVVTFTVDDGCSVECCWNNDAWVNPVDTRTDEEKAFDSFLDLNYNMKRSDFSQSQDDKDFIEGVYLAFKAGVTWSKGNE